MRRRASASSREASKKHICRATLRTPARSIKLFSSQSCVYPGPPSLRLSVGFWSSCYETPIVPLTRIHIHIHCLWCRYSIPCQAQLLPRLLCTHRRCLIHLAHLGPATVPHREPLLPAMTLRWPREPSRYDALLAHSLRQQGSEAFTKPCTVTSKPS